MAIAAARPADTQVSRSPTMHTRLASYPGSHSLVGDRREIIHNRNRNKPRIGCLPWYQSRGIYFLPGARPEAGTRGDGHYQGRRAAFMRCLSVTLDTFEVTEPERSEVVAFATSMEG
jgi:hypothetical protein